MQLKPRTIRPLWESLPWWHDSGIEVKRSSALFFSPSRLLRTLLLPLFAMSDGLWLRLVLLHALSGLLLCCVLHNALRHPRAPCHPCKCSSAPATWLVFKVAVSAISQVFSYALRSFLTSLAQTHIWTRGWFGWITVGFTLVWKGF